MLNCPNLLQPQTPTFLPYAPTPSSLMHHFCIVALYTAMSHTKIFEIPHLHYFGTVYLQKPQCNTKLWKAELQKTRKTEGRVFCH